jgi:hypothetical protein
MLTPKTNAKKVNTEIKNQLWSFKIKVEFNQNARVCLRLGLYLFECSDEIMNIREEHP